MAAKKSVKKKTDVVDTLTTPIVPIEYAWLTKADTKFNADGVYKANLVFSKTNAEHMAFLKKAKELCVSLTDDDGVKVPFKAEGETYVMKVKTKNKPKLFDRHRAPILDEVSPGPGTTARVVIKFAPYEGFGGGVTAYMNKVQIVDYVPFVGGSDEFEDEGGDDEEGESFGDARPQAEPEGMSADEIPF